MGPQRTWTHCTPLLEEEEEVLAGGNILLVAVVLISEALPGNPLAAKRQLGEVVYNTRHGNITADPGR